MRRSFAAAAVALLCAVPVRAAAAPLPLPAPQAQQLSGVELFQALGVFGDQLPGYKVPGTVTEHEVVRVELAADGSAQRIVDDQRLVLSGVGDYIVRESGPALAVSATGDDTPIVTLGDVVWQGFSTGDRTLGASIELDPAVEAFHLPLQVRVAFRSADGSSRPLGPGGRVPGPGTVTVTLTNDTVQPMTLPTAGDVSASVVATVLDGLARVAGEVAGSGRPPSTRDAAPTTLPVDTPARRVALAVPLRVQGRLGWTGSSAGSQHTAGIDQLLSGPAAQVSLPVPSAGTLSLDVSAVPTLPPATLSPPRPFATWAAWARSGPTPTARRGALDLVVTAAAIGARASAFSPYLGSLLAADGTTAFRYGFAAAPPAALVAAPLRPRPVPIALAAVGLLLLAAAGATLWRRS